VGGSLVIETNHVHVVAWLGSIQVDFDLGSQPAAGPPSTIYWFSAPANANEGDTITLNAAATDSQGNQITDGSSYHWTLLRNGNTIATGTGAAFPVTLGDPGTYQANLAVIDPSGNNVMLRNGTIAVTDVLPKITSLNLLSAYASGVKQTFTPSVTAVGPSASNGALSYAWSVTKNGAVYNPGDASSYTGTSFSFTPLAPNNQYHAPDIYSITLTVADKFGGSTTTTGTFAVVDPANVMVDTILDNGTGTSLRTAIAVELQTAQSYAIHFSPSLAYDTIYLSQIGDFGDYGSSAIAIPANKSITIDANDVPGIVISAASNSNKRLFYVAPHGSLSLTNVGLTGGAAYGTLTTASGGAIYADGLLNLQNCSLFNNTATGTLGFQPPGTESDGQGGAVYSTFSFSAFNTTFANNTAVGAMGIYPGTVTAGGVGRGGAVAIGGGEFLCYNCTITGNSAISGGYATNASQGGGVYEAPSDLGRYLNNDIIYGNMVYPGTSPARADDYENYGNLTFSFGGTNLIGVASGIYPSMILTSANPQLGPLAAHGNGLLTYSLQPGSPAIGVGNVGATWSSPVDGRGSPRLLNGFVDLGAVERQPYVVTNLNDSGPGSLRTAVLLDDDGSPIIFAPSITSGVLNLTSGPINVASNLSITGPNTGRLVIDPNGTSRIFTVQPGVTATFASLTLADGKATQGGAIYNFGNVIVTGTTFLNDAAVDDTVNFGAGGAIYNAAGASLVVTGSTFAHDTATGPFGPAAGVPNAYGGAIFNSAGATLSASEDSFDANSAQAGSFAVGRYGADGYLLYNSFNSAGSFNSVPAYAATAVTGASYYTWSLVSSDIRGLVNPNVPSTRLVSSIYGQTFAIDLKIYDNKPHQVSLYLLDVDGNKSRAERIDVIDPTTGATLDSRSVSSFSSGEYLSWVISGHVQFKVTNLASASNALVSGLFFDAPPSGVTGLANYLGTDLVSQGNWPGTPGTAKGGAIENQGIASISSSTFSGGILSAYPASAASGGAIDNASGGTLTVYNDVATGSTGAGDVSNSGSIHGGHLLAGSTSGVPAAMVLPVGNGASLRSLANNGGPTPTLALLPTSSAADTGDNTAAASPLATVPGLIDWLRGDGDGQDSAGGTAGTLQNVTFATGNAGQAFQFNGKNSFVMLPPTDDVVGTGAFSVSAWIKTSADGVIIQQRDAANFNGEYVLAVTGGKINWLTYGGNQYGFNITTTKSVADNTWHQITAVRQADGSGVIYIDGIQSGFLSGTASPLGSGFKIYVGGDLRDNVAFFNGLIDDVALFNRGLTATEAKALAANAPPATDQRGMARVAGTVVDVGSFELQPYVVTNTNDSGPGSLRQAVIDNVAGDEPIQFAAALAGKTITLTSGPIAIGHNLTITGLGADKLTVSGGGAVQDFVVSAGTVTISGLTIASGAAVQGGGLFNAGNVALTNVAFVNDIAHNDPASSGGRISQGGAVYDAAGASLVVSGSTFSGDAVTGVSSTGQDGRGGAIYNAPGANFSATDDTFAGDTAQSQKGYGIDGFAVFGDNTKYPAYATVNLTSATPFAWAGSTNDARALQKSAPATSDRIAACDYAASSFSIDVNLTDGRPHVVSLYVLDFDTNNVRSERIDVITASGANTGTTLDSRTVSSFSSGKYLSWVVSGHVTFKITALTSNAVVSGVFFDPAPAGTSGPATFVGTDTTTQGNWRGTGGTAAFGGAIDNAGTATISNSTIGGNSALGSSGDGSGVFNETGASLRLFDTIVAGGSSGHAIVNSGTMTGGTDLVTSNQGVSPSLILSSADPLLGPLQNNGGPTATMALGNGSAALDSGNPAGAPQYDQRGMARIVGNGIDIGAFESVGGPPSADAGDGYVISGGHSVTLNGGDSFDPAGIPLTYSWDINGDGVFGDATGASPTLSWFQLQALGIKPQTSPYVVTVRVTNDDDTVTSTSTSLSVMPDLKIASLSAGIGAVTNAAVDAVTVTFTTPIDTTTLSQGAVSLTRDGATLLLGSPLQVTLMPGTSATYRVSGLQGFTNRDANYVLTVDVSAVSDDAGPGAGKASVSWLLDSTAPSSGIQPLAAKQTDARFTITTSDSDASSQDAPSSGLLGTDVYVSTNGGAYSFWTTILAGSSSAVFHGSQNTSYSFFSVGRDAAGNQSLPSPVVGTFVPAAPRPAVPKSIVVDSGQVVRSFIGTVDVNFGPNEDLQSVVAGGHVHLFKYSPSGKAVGTVAITGKLHVVDQAIELDFGPQGLGGNPNSTAGDGYYKLTVDGDSTSFYFERLLGDVNGDGVVNKADIAIIKKSMGTHGVKLRGDVNGDGIVNKTDLKLAKRANGHKISHPKR
jgi:hypothetical protein